MGEKKVFRSQCSVFRPEGDGISRRGPSTPLRTGAKVTENLTRPEVSVTRMPFSSPDIVSRNDGSRLTRTGECGEFLEGRVPPRPSFPCISLPHPVYPVKHPTPFPIQTDSRELAPPNRIQTARSAIAPYHALRSFPYSIAVPAYSPGPRGKHGRATP